MHTPHLFYSSFASLALTFILFKISSQWYFPLYHFISSFNWTHCPCYSSVWSPFSSTLLLTLWYPSNYSSNAQFYLIFKSSVSSFLLNLPSRSRVVFPSFILQPNILTDFLKYPHRFYKNIVFLTHKILLLILSHSCTHLILSWTAHFFPLCWFWIFERNLDKSLNCFPPCYSKSPQQLCLETSVS